MTGVECSLKEGLKLNEDAGPSMFSVTFETRYFLIVSPCYHIDR